LEPSADLSEVPRGLPSPPRNGENLKERAGATLIDNGVLEEASGIGNRMDTRVRKRDDSET
jgi:hypothetical protein